MRPREVVGGVRFQATAAALLVVAIAFVIGAGALLAAMRSALLTDLRAVSVLRAEEIAASLEAGDRPTLAVAEPEGQLVQVLDGDGDVVAASSSADRLHAVADIAPGQSATVRTPPAEDQLLVVAVAARDVPATVSGGAGGDLIVLVARSLDDALESMQLVAGLLAAGAPVLLLVVGLTTRALVGQALAPVEAIRAEVERISTAELDRRVPHRVGRDEIARLAETMNGMLARLEEGQTRQRRFVADASHELRSPVATLRQHAEVARSYPDRSALPELTETVLIETDRMQDLLESREPPADEYRISRLEADFPEGHYVVSGLDPEGLPRVQTAVLTHAVPAAPVITAPTLATEDAADSAPLPASDLLVRWEPVRRTIDGAPVTITGYQVVVSKVDHGDEHGLTRPVYDVHLPPDATELEVVEAFLEQGTVYELEVLAIEESGN